MILERRNRERDKWREKAKKENAVLLQELYSAHILYLKTKN